MKIENLPISSITPYARNPRKNEGVPVAKVKASLKEYGWRQPIVVDKDKVIVVGHTRYQAALELGMAEVPVHIADSLTPNQIRAYRIADNKTATFSEFDMELLALEIDDLKAANFDLELTGFDADELAGIELEEPDAGSGGDTEPQIDMADELRVKWGVEYGDLWALGDHRLLCGDSTKAEDVGRVLGDDRPHLMVTDPPYGVEYDASWRNKAFRENGKPIGARAIGKVKNDDRADWREAWALFPGDVAYIWHGGINSPQVAASLVSCGFVLRNLIIWGKSNMVVGRGNYHHKHEPCWYAVKENATGHWQGDRTQTTLWDINKPQKSETGHSTQKPLECMARPIRNNSAVGDFIYDPFCGSGTTIIAAENLNRKARAIEISPAYVAVALERYLTHVGKTPTRL